MDDRDRPGQPQQIPPPLGLPAAVMMSLAGQVGCVTILILVGALVAGLWLDRQLHTRPWLTVGLLVISVPISMFAMLRVVQNTTRQLMKLQHNRDKENRDV